MSLDEEDEREEKTVKAEELRNTTRIHTEFFGLPTCSQAGSPGHEGLREERAREERVKDL